MSTQNILLYIGLCKEQDSKEIAAVTDFLVLEQISTFFQ